MLNVKYEKEIKLSPEEYKYYSKQLILDNIGVQGQQKLKNAKVLMIGAGGLGCPTILYLATSGIGYIGLIDGDKIENSNLNRQILYNINDINNFKVDSAQKKIQTINNNCKIIKHRYELNTENSIEILSKYDIVVDTTDNFNTRYIIDKTCYKLHKTYIYGAIDKFNGQVVVFNYKNGIRYKDLYKQNLLIANDHCNRNGIMGITTGYIGILQAIETIKTILGLEKKCKNFLLIYNTINTINKRRKISLKRDNNNEISITKFNNIMLSSKLKTINNKIIIIDLRTELDFNTKHIKRSINIPIKEFKLNKTIKLIKYHMKQSHLILYCNTLERSVIASHFLTQNSISNDILHPIK
uniref:Molybdopterin biosynthesis protein n=1 Tax=Symphyocladiella dendroidea TaxID=2506487 RepID=A0A1Z1M884_9FLOR|nr:Molybdopterin biosynthesis protein [Symphyocladiella dendroidea]ARW61964.1 Molybdopterin biosynthesis protein [Symphyocladiella dendroidea]